MVKDIIKYNSKEYQLSTVNLDGLLETMIFPIEDDVISGREVYCFRTVKADESIDKHGDIYYHPEKYLSDEAIAEYIKSKKDTFEVKAKILFPFEHINRFINGVIEFDTAVNMTIDECYRLIGEYIANNSIKT